MSRLEGGMLCFTTGNVIGQHCWEGHARRYEAEGVVTTENCQALVDVVT